MTETAWCQWAIGENGLPATGERCYEIHVVPEEERRRHRPQECWCEPVLDVTADGVPRFTHRLQYVNNTLERKP
jgi:hypothetical protein